MTTTAVAADNCWSRIGVEGDRTCAELARVGHCHNCEVYARAGRRLFEQEAPAEYLARWAAQLAAAQENVDSDDISVVVFRIANERLALPTVVFVEAVDERAIHRIPHRSSDSLLGLTSIRGELQLCVSLAAMLAIEPPTGPETPVRRSPPRFAVIEREGEAWVFPVDELIGVHRIPRRVLEAPPATITRDAEALTTALFACAGDRVALVDADLLFTRLRRTMA